MLQVVARGLRDRLRYDTAADHDRLDARFSQLDLQVRADFPVFLAAHFMAFSTLRRLGMQGRLVRQDDLARFEQALGRDLNVFGHNAHPTLTMDAPCDPIALDHIVLGSRLGTAVLRKRWQGSSDAMVLRAGAYFGLPQDAHLWRQHCAAMAERDETGADADRAVADTRRLFGLFETALSRAEQAQP